MEEQKNILNKKLIAGIAILVVLSTIAVGLFIGLAQKQSPTTTTAPNNTGEKVVKNGPPTISLSPSVITLKTGQSDYSVTVMVNSQDVPVQGVALEIEYDPSALSSVKIVPSSDADLNLGGAIKIESSDSNPTIGRASLAIRKNPSQKLSPQKVSGRVAIIYFTVTKKATTTSISLTNASEFITADTLPTNPQKTGVTIKSETALAPNTTQSTTQFNTVAGDTTGSACSTPNKQCLLSKSNSSTHASADCTGCGGYCYNTGSSGLPAGYGQCVNFSN